MGRLPGGLGRYRVSIPWFDLPGGPSLAYIGARETSRGVVIDRLGKGIAYSPDSRFTLSWKGMRVFTGPDWGRVRSHSAHRWMHVFTSDIGVSLPPSVIVEVDLCSPLAGRIEVARDYFQLTSQGAQAVQWVCDKARHRLHAFVCSRHYSAYCVANARITGQLDVQTKIPSWLAPTRPASDGSFHWRPVKFPAVSSSIAVFEKMPLSATWRGRKVSILPALGLSDSMDEQHYTGIPWTSPGLPGAVMVHVKGQPALRRLNVLWPRNPWSTKKGKAPGTKPVAAFPPRWRDIVGARLYQNGKYEMLFWNESHPVIRSIPPNAWNAPVSEWFVEDDFPQVKAKLSGDRTEAAKWFVWMLSKRKFTIWEALIDHSAELALSIWKTLNTSGKTGSSLHGIGFWDKDILIWVTSNACAVCTFDTDEGRKAIDLRLPDPGVDWSLVVDPGEEDILYPSLRAGVTRWSKRRKGRKQA